MKALCELCGQIFVLMEFVQSLPFLLRDGGRIEISSKNYGKSKFLLREICETRLVFQLEYPTASSAGP